MTTPDAFTAKTLPDAIRALFEDNQYLVRGPVKISGAEIDLVAESLHGFAKQVIYIEATIEYVNTAKYGKDLTKLAMVARRDPTSTQLIVSSKGFTLDVVERAKELGIETLTIDELRARFSRFDSYLKSVTDSGPLAAELQALVKSYEEPFLIEDRHEFKALTWLDEWLALNSSETRWLVITGEYGTGKTALSKVLQYRWSKEVLANSHQPIPFRIELRQFSRQFDADGLLHRFLDSNNMSHVPLAFINSLIADGRIVLILDGYDEMAQYLSARERRTCLAALATLSRDGARGILTSRPNFFSEAEELRIIETLYQVAANQLRLMGATSQLLEHERNIDDLFANYFVYRVEKSLKDLDKDQSLRLVHRHLGDRPDAERVVTAILDKLFSGDGSSKGFLGGKPVVISYLFDVIDGLSREDQTSLEVSDWSVYELIFSKLMARDFDRSPEILPNERIEFLGKLALLFSTRHRSSIDEDGLRAFVRDTARRVRLATFDEQDEKIETRFADLRGSATLTRSGSDYQFSHNSLREFIATRQLLTQLRRNDVAGIGIAVTDAMRVFANSRSPVEVTEDSKALSLAWSTHGRRASVWLNLLWDTMLASASDGPSRTSAMLAHVLGGDAALEEASLSRVTFSDAVSPQNLTHLRAPSCTISKASFDYADLSSANFAESYLDSVSFVNCNLSGATFRASILEDVVFSGATVTGSDFRAVDPDISIIVAESDPGGPRPLRLAGHSAIGYLTFHGAKADSIPSGYILQFDQRFPVVEKICRKLREQKRRQLRGLVQRGAAHQDPVLARKFVEYLRTKRLVEDDRSRTGFLINTSLGMECFGRMFEGSRDVPEPIRAFFDT